MQRFDSSMHRHPKTLPAELPAPTRPIELKHTVGDSTARHNKQSRQQSGKTAQLQQQASSVKAIRAPMQQASLPVADALHSNVGHLNDELRRGIWHHRVQASGPLTVEHSPVALEMETLIDRCSTKACKVLILHKLGKALHKAAAVRR